MQILALAATAAMASVLLWAGLEKTRSLSSFAVVLHQLGAPARSARGAAALVAGVELGVALGLIFRPGSLPTLGGVLGLAVAYTFSGLVALRRDVTIRCGCFGPYGDKFLGNNQLAAFPLWLVGVALLWVNRPAHSSDVHSVSMLAVVALTIAALRGVSTLRAALEARGDRRSAKETFVWLNR